MHPTNKVPVVIFQATILVDCICWLSEQRYSLVLNLVYTFSRLFIILLPYWLSITVQLSLLLMTYSASAKSCHLLSNLLIPQVDLCSFVLVKPILT